MGGSQDRLRSPLDGWRSWGSTQRGAFSGEHRTPLTEVQGEGMERLTLHVQDNSGFSMPGRVGGITDVLA